MQSTLTSFVKSKPGKRPRDDEDDQEDKLTPEEHGRAEANRMRALAKKGGPDFFYNLELFVPKDWKDGIKSFYSFDQPKFLRLKDFLVAEAKTNVVYPPCHQVFAALEECPLARTRVVILGQDPYHNVGQSHGLAFSVTPGTPAPPSLVNMFKELTNDIPGFVNPGHGYLMDWAKQGVLLLNTSLTVRAHSPQSHAKKGWESFTDALIRAVAALDRPIVFLLWGNPAKSKMKLIDAKRHHVLTAAHPSPLSASRGWFGSKHFSQCNKLLASDGEKEIDWKSLPV